MQKKKSHKNYFRLVIGNLYQKYPTKKKNSRYAPAKPNPKPAKTCNKKCKNDMNVNTVLSYCTAETKLGNRIS